MEINKYKYKLIDTYEENDELVLILERRHKYYSKRFYENLINDALFRHEIEERVGYAKTRYAFDSDLIEFERMVIDESKADLVNEIDIKILKELKELENYQLNDKEYKIFKSDITGAIHDIINNRVFFYGGIFSQWAECKFYVPHLDFTVNCAEQGMMLTKAKMFEDHEIYEKIKNSKNPSEQKMLGRMVKNFDEKYYYKHILDYVSDINYEKFSQNPIWKEVLIMLHEYEFIEASPTDKIWGIGLGIDNPKIYDPLNWQGKNLLGIAISNAQQKIIDNIK